MIVKVLGGIDLIGAFVFLIMVFGFQPFLPLMLFASGLLFLKGLFAFTGDVLSFIDLFASLIILLGIFFAMPVFLLWIPAFLLLGKGLISFI